MCWAIVSAEVVSAAVNIKRRAKGLDLIKLSCQELLDCCKEEQKQCYLNSIPKALNWIKDKGIMTENEYPYKGFKCECRAKIEEQVKNYNFYFFYIIVVYIYIYIYANSLFSLPLEIDCSVY